MSRSTVEHQPSKNRQIVYAFLGGIVDFAIFGGLIFVFSLAFPKESANYVDYKTLAAFIGGWVANRMFRALRGKPQ